VCALILLPLFFDWEQLCCRQNKYLTCVISLLKEALLCRMICQNYHSVTGRIRSFLRTELRPTLLFSKMPSASGNKHFMQLHVDQPVLQTSLECQKTLKQRRPSTTESTRLPILKLLRYLAEAAVALLAYRVRVIRRNNKQKCDPRSVDTNVACKCCYIPSPQHGTYTGIRIALSWRFLAVF